MSDRTSNISYVPIVTAAGRGERMGCPKALLAVRWGEGTGELPLAIAHARAHLDHGVPRVVVVLRPEVARLLAVFAQRGLDLVLSNAPDEDGPAGSIRSGVALLDADDDAPHAERDPWLLIEPVDTPPTSLAVRRELLSATTREPAAVRPVFEGKRGHPVLIRRRYLEPLLDGTMSSLRELLRHLEATPPSGTSGVLDVPVGDVRAVTGFDVPSDVAAFYGHAPRFFVEDDPTNA